MGEAAGEEPVTAVRDVQLSAFPEIQPDKPVGKVIGSVQTGTNAELIERVAPLYLSGSVLDVTYGEGKWWERFQPTDFTYHDLHKVDGVDFTNLPHDDRTFDTVCFDPPYVMSGGESATHDGFQDAYGVGNKYIGSNSGFAGLIHDGLVDSARVARRWLLVKCMEFASGEFQDVPYMVTRWALDECGMIKHDQIVHFTGTGPGGHNIFTPKRARRNHSYLIVFRRRAP